MEKVIIATRGDDGWILGAFTDIEKAKKYVDEEVDNYESYECDYWESEVNLGGSTLNP